MDSKDGHQHHDKQIDKSYGNQILPFKTQQLVDTQTRERPFEPHDDKHHNRRLTEEPDKRGDIIHHIIESLPTAYM